LAKGVPRAGTLGGREKKVDKVQQVLEQRLSDGTTTTASCSSLAGLVLAVHRPCQSPAMPDSTVSLFWVPAVLSLSTKTESIPWR
jgi:hypothetical protein